MNKTSKPDIVRVPTNSHKTFAQVTHRANQTIIFLLLFVTLQATSPISHAKTLDRQLVARAEAVSGDRFRFKAETARGAHVFSVNQPQQSTLDAIDRGLTDLFAVARKHNYRARMDYGDYTIFIARPDRTKDSAGAYSPDIALSAKQYAGSVYDQGGYVYAAGMVLTLNPCALVIAEHESNLERLSNVVRYEGEHLVLYHNDRALFQKTLDHSRGGSHPIIQ